MTTFHVVAAAGDTAEDLRSLGAFEAPSAMRALRICLDELDHDPVAEIELRLLQADGLVDLLRAERAALRHALAQPDVSFIVVPTAAEVHLVRDLDGEIKDASTVERKRAQMRRDFGIDVV